MPRAATSVATQTRARPSRSACSAWVRSLCVNSPDSATTEKPRSSSVACRCRTASRVLQNTSALGDSKKRSTLTTACSTSPRGDPDGAVLDIGVAAFVARDLDAKGLLLIVLRQRDDAARQGRREQQRAAGVRRGLEDEFHILAKAQIEHFVGLVEHDGLQLRDVEAIAPQMIAQPAGRADHDVRAGGKLALFAARIHAADAGNDARVRILIEPGEFALHLQGKLAGRRHDQGKRCGGPLEPLGSRREDFRDRQPIGDGLA